MNPRSVRNLNPGNVRPRPGAPWPGQSGVDTDQPDPPYARFGTAVDGFDCLASQIIIYGGRGIRTVHDIISKWAPSSENNTTAYIAGVAADMKVAPAAWLDTTDATVLAGLAQAIARYEAGSGQWWLKVDMVAGIDRARRRAGFTLAGATAPAPTASHATETIAQPVPAHSAALPAPAAAPAAANSKVALDAVLDWFKAQIALQPDAVADQRFTTILERLTTMSDDVQTVLAEVADLKTTVTTMSGDIADLGTRVNATNALVESSKADTAAALTKIDTLEAAAKAQDLAAVSAAIADVKASVVSMDTSVKGIDVTPVTVTPPAPVAPPVAPAPAATPSAPTGTPLTAS